uniref:Uncharacterized protein n=1 Tax=Anguilla anguilla TaxID=7936 RepID=A0A0E9TFL8_ANGAN
MTRLHKEDSIFHFCGCLNGNVVLNGVLKFGRSKRQGTVSKRSRAGR